MQPDTFPIILTETCMLSSSVKHFVFRAEQTGTFQYLPGQFITIHFEHEGKIIKRSYSIANVPAQDNRIEFAAGYINDGPGSKLLFNLQTGDRLQINGPFGRLVLKDEIPQRYILVATSTGITPYRSMLQELERRILAGPELKVVIIQGVQTGDDVLYRQEFMAFAKAYPQQVSFRIQLSRNTTASLQPHEYSGRVQQSFPELDLNPGKDMVYLCGNPGMIDESFADLKERGFDTHRIIREKYISAK